MGFYRALNGVGGKVYIGPIDRGSMGFHRSPIGLPGGVYIGLST